MSNDIIRDRIRGSLFAGAAGDALGYTIEFMSDSEIKDSFGQDGIKEYDKYKGIAMISDDTQMTLFTACGLLNCHTRNIKNGTQESPINDIYKCYLDWKETQYKKSCGKYVSWIMKDSRLYSARLPGNTCLSALNSGVCGTPGAPINDSKGDGGIMRTAPAALLRNITGIKSTMRLAAESSAITHGHPLGYIPSAAAAYIIHTLAFYEGDSTELLERTAFSSLVRDAVKESVNLFPSEYGDYFSEKVEQALELVDCDLTDMRSIFRIGRGFVAEETFAIAVYSIAKYGSDFDKALCCSVNHGGDSDTTGAVAGNILGAAVGYNAIGDKWKKDLELSDLILEIADDLAQMYSDSDEWSQKYSPKA